MWCVWHVIGVSINAYADDEHIYDSDNDPVRYRSETSMPF